MTPDPRYAARMDANHKRIEEALTAAGYYNCRTHKQGWGFPDHLAVSKTNIPVLMEIKQRDEHLTDAEQEFHAAYKGPLEVVYDEQQAVDLMEYWDGYRLEAA